MARNKKQQRREKQSLQKKISLAEKFEKFFNSKYFAFYISAFFFAALCIVSYSFHKIGDYGVETDFYQGYVPAAKEFQHGKILIDAFRGPVYQIVLGIFGFLFGDLFKAGIFIGVLSASCFIFFTFKTIQNIYSTKISALAILFLIFNPVFIQYTYSAGTDMFFAALLSVSFYFLFRSENFSYKNLTIASLFGALAYLTRYNGVFILGFPAVILFINYWSINWKERLRASLVFSFVFFLSITPWGIYCLKERDNFFFNDNYKNIAYELYGRGKINWDQFWYGSSNQFSSFTDVIFKDPVLFLKVTLENIYNHLIGDMQSLLGWYIGVFVILGILFFIYNKPVKNLHSRKNGYVLMNIFFFLILLLVFYSERFSLFLLPFYLVLMLSGLIGGQNSLSKIISKQFVNFIIIFLVGFSVIKTYDFNASRIDSGPEEILVFKKWYFENIPENKRGKIVAARKPQIAYYLDMKFNLIPLADNYQQLIENLRKDKDDYLYFSIIEAQTRPQFQFLLDPKRTYPGLEPLVYIQNPPAVLYKVLDETK